MNIKTKYLFSCHIDKNEQLSNIQYWPENG